jgi:hypothetical protein
MREVEPDPEIVVIYVWQKAIADHEASKIQL